WVPDEDAGASTVSATIRVTDDGPGDLSATQRVEIQVRPRFKVVFSEILQKSSPAGAEFIELFNRSTRTTWDLSGVQLIGSNLSFTFPAGTSIGPDARLLIVGSRARVTEVFGLFPGIVGEWNGTLGTVADSLRLVRPAVAGSPESVLERVDYDGLAPWPSGTAGPNRSLQLVDARQDRNRPGNWAEASVFQGSRRVIGFTDVWKYYQDGAPAGGTNWITPSYNDSAWPSGGGLLYVESATLSTNKTTALTLGQSAYYFRRKVSIPALTAGVTVRFRVMLDDGYVLWVNGRKAHVLGIDDSALTHDTFANRTVGDAALEGPFTLPSGLLVPGENTFAVEVHQANAGSSDIVFGLEVTLEGGDSSTLTPGAPNNVAAVLPEFPTVRINEVLARNGQGLKDATGKAEPWLELVNTGDQPVALDGLFLADNPSGSNRWTFPAAAVLSPGGFRVVFADGESAQTSLSEWHASFRLPAATGSAFLIMLGREVGGGVQAVDLFRAAVGGSDDRSWSRISDGDPATLVDTAPSPGVSNRGVPAPRLEVVGFLPDGSLRLKIDGASGRRYRLDRGGTLGSWSPLQEWTAAEASRVLDDPGSFSSAARFYRVVDVTPQ
ncbi:MAG: lamin tail domain-containing protein, partial [Verrucomicrobiota bacterium]